ncbi:hypothetical protein IW140_003388 [Coemansia sp. RSA 1813]|nr:hypothetical protein EV178_003206 [Coemansia sp. RSA 1646]KAJ1771013.1 hypothetical protein LPJ74_002704 [Coemansia sp. RSA 1843]KAJ2089253.1 hypothetical protein IW138_003573 [Coemansia sp. RSA 986]KAJ2215082.1 hypothetical protein EV179_002450 [Coemansia sp. RSA 487]KAJ2569023.1 hypothetical protein IW140_003388 [Coemansia sp. RSA 1813]
MNFASQNAFEWLPDNATNSEVPISSLPPKKKQAPKPAKSNKPAAPAVPTTTVSAGRGGSRRTVIRESADTPEYARSGRPDNRPAQQTQRQRGPAPRTRGRQFDRHSGTGLVDSEKKEKQGWLGDTEALVADGEKATEEAKKDSQDGTATPVPPTEEPEEVVKTLDDYLKEKSSKKIDSARTLRKANEGGVDKNQLKAGVPLERVEEDFFAPLVGSKTRKQKERKEKIHVDINQHFVDQQRRGAFRSNRNEGGPRSNDRRPKRQQRANINDERDFPSL